jgi:tetrahydromethanopterin S-methyltransferase subunit G
MVQGMKWFWYSLIGFCLFLCSCKTQKSARLINEVSKENTQTEWNKFQALIDTSSALKIEIDKSKLKFIETITTKKYDKDTGAITEETKTEREITQDSDKVVAEEENQSVTNRNGFEVEHNADISKKIDSEVKEESIGGQEAFGKWFGIVIGVIVGLLLLYLMRKLRVN